jgi:glycosyltransferase involved in cell wall biosynthesis
VKIVIHIDSPSIRGNEMQSILLSRGLRGRSHEVVLACRANGPIERMFQLEGFRTSSIRPRGDIDPYNALRFARWLRAERPDAFLNTSWKRVYVAAWAARIARVPRVVLRLGGVHDLRRGALARFKYVHALVHHYDALIVNSGRVEDHLLRIVPELRPESVYRIENGIELSSTSPSPIRSDLGIPQGAILLFSAGGLEARKGYDTLIEALGMLPLDVHLAIAGEGPDRGSLRMLGESLGVTDRLHLLGQRADVPGLISASDIFAMSSRGEGMAHAMLEAMAERRPIVSTDVGGVAETLAPSDDRPAGGWIVAQNDASALARTLAEVIHLLRNDPQKVFSRVSEAAWRLEHWLSVDRMVERYERVLMGDVIT